jgi:hypothetical protein
LTFIVKELALRYPFASFQTVINELPRTKHGRSYLTRATTNTTPPSKPTSVTSLGTKKAEKET